MASAIQKQWLLKRMGKRADQKRMDEQYKSAGNQIADIYGNRGKEQVTSDYRMGNDELFPGETQDQVTQVDPEQLGEQALKQYQNNMQQAEPVQGLLNIDQEKVDASGMFDQNVPIQERIQQVNRGLLQSGNPMLMKQGFANMKQQQNNLMGTVGDSDGRDNPMSPSSISMQRFAANLYPDDDWTGMTAVDIGAALTARKQQQGLQQQGARDDKRMAFEARKQERLDVKNEKKFEHVSKAGNIIPAETAGSVKVDTDFAPDYNEWNTNGRASLRKNLAKLKKAKAYLIKSQAGWNPTTSGGLIGKLPEIFRGEKSLIVQQDAQEAAMAGLKAALGSAFTEGEGKRIMAASYDPQLEEQANIDKLNAVILELEDKAKANEKQGKYWRANGSTLRGYNPNSKSRTGGTNITAADKIVGL